MPVLTLEEVAKKWPVEEMLSKARKRAENEHWLSEHLDQIRKKYGDSFVAVNDGEIVAHAKTLKVIRRMLGDRFDPGVCAVGYVFKNEPYWVL